MKPSTALQLVERYARMTKEIKQRTKEIGEHLEKCPGVKGDRLAVDDSGWQIYSPELDSKNRDKGLHLWSWYQPEKVENDHYGGDHLEWLEIGSAEAEECSHCYAAHLAIQARKQSKRKLGAVRGAMSRAA